jgi:hypothetical protein
MQRKTTRKIIISLITFVVFVSLMTFTLATYVMQSNNLTHTSSAQVTITLTQNATTSIVNADTVRLIANEASLTGTVVSFYDGTTLLGTAVSSGGSAVFDYPITAAKTFTFHATATHP